MENLLNLTIAMLVLLDVTVSEIGAGIGIASSVIIAVTFFVGFVWWVWKGKNAQQCADDLKRAEKRIEEYKQEAELESKRRVQADLDKAKAETGKIAIEAKLSETEGELQRAYNRGRRIDEEWKVKEENWEKLKMRMLGEIQTRGGNIEQFKD